MYRSIGILMMMMIVVVIYLAPGVELNNVNSKSYTLSGVYIVEFSTTLTRMRSNNHV